MKIQHKLLKITVISIFFLLIAAPFITLSGAVKGVRLWFNTVLPSILPCIIMSDIVIRSYGSEFKNPCAYILFTGLLCGYPMGAKSCAELYGSNESDAKNTQWLLALCNASSPMFVVNYVITQTLQMKSQLLKILIIFYMPIIIMIIIEFIRHHSFYIRNSSKVRKDNSSYVQTGITLDIVDSSIMDGFKIITHLGGYILLFSICSEFVQNISLPGQLTGTIICGILEITTGTALIAASDITEAIQILISTACLAFGGLSCAAQTQSVLNGTYYSIKKYIYHKLFIAALTALTAWFVIYVLKI